MKTFSEKSSSKDTLTRNQQGTNHKQVPVKKSVPAFPGSIPLIQRKSLCPCDGGCPKCTNGGTIQPKLTIRQPNDKYEQEADRVADQIMRMQEKKESLVNGHWSLVQRKAGCSGCMDEEEEVIHTKPIADQITPLVQRQSESDIEEEEEEAVQLKSSTDKSPPVTAGLQSQIQSMKGGGQPLPESTRAFFEPRFGLDFSQVRVHTDSKAADAAKSINSKAFTTGKDIVFGAGQYSPGTTAGKHLLGHELSHVVQQAAASESTNIYGVRIHRVKALQANSAPNIQRLIEHGSADPELWTSKILRIGSQGPAVEHLQRLLNDTGAKLDVDGIFGPLTQNSVVKFQDAAGLLVDGIVGPETWEALDAYTAEIPPSSTDAEGSTVPVPSDGKPGIPGIEPVPGDRREPKKPGMEPVPGGGGQGTPVYGGTGYCRPTTDMQLESWVDVITEPEGMIIGQIFFLTSDFVIDSQDASELFEIVEYVKQMQEDDRFNVTLVGYADYRGKEKYNETLAENRAFAVEGYLKANLLEDPRFNVPLTEGRGEKIPIPNVPGCEFALASHRRVDIFATIKIVPQKKDVPPSEKLPFLDLQLYCIAKDMEICNLPGGTPNDEMVREADKICREKTKYNGPPVQLSDLDCENIGLMIGRSLYRAYGKDWLEVLPDCYCTAKDAESSGLFDMDNLFIGIYHKGADSCYRSKKVYKSVQGTNHRQQCCYDDKGMLITEGSGAGTPDAWKSFWNHQNIDRESWDDIKNFEVYNIYWKPNNDKKCPSNRKE